MVVRSSIVGIAPDVNPYPAVVGRMSRMGVRMMHIAKNYDRMKRLFVAAVALGIGSAVTTGAARAAEGWACSFQSATHKSTRVTYVVDANELVETFQSGSVKRFQLMEHNQYGLVGISTMAAIEGGQPVATVGFDAIAIDARTHEAWHATAVSEQPPELSSMVHGICSNKLD